MWLHITFYWLVHVEVLERVTRTKRSPVYILRIGVSGEPAPLLFVSFVRQSFSHKDWNFVPNFLSVQTAQTSGTDYSAPSTPPDSPSTSPSPTSPLFGSASNPPPPASIASSSTSSSVVNNNRRRRSRPNRSSSGHRYAPFVVPCRWGLQVVPYGLRPWLGWLWFGSSTLLLSWLANLPKQNWADWTRKIKVYQTQVSDQMGHPVRYGVAKYITPFCPHAHGSPVGVHQRRAKP